jgi:hypothetical protein
MHIRPEAPSDHAAVHDINVAAFGREAEARLVAMLREQARPLVSLVAEDAGTTVGHIMFSPVSLGGFARLLMGLAPMAVARRALRPLLRIRRARGSVRCYRARAGRFERRCRHRVVPPGVRRSMTRFNALPGGSISAGARCCSGCSPCSSACRRCRSPSAASGRRS